MDLAEAVQEIYEPPKKELLVLQVPLVVLPANKQSVNDGAQTIKFPQPTSIVDKTETTTSLHQLVNTPDRLTKEADADEEKFIEEVKKHHDHQ